MYFSMHDVKQPSSPLEREGPGLGTQRSKQCSLSFYAMKSAFRRIVVDCMPVLGVEAMRAVRNNVEVETGAEVVDVRKRNW